MSEYIEFTSNGFILNEWDKSKKEYVKKKVKKSKILTYLRWECRIAEGTTLKQIFKTIDRYKTLKFFISQYSWCPQIEEFQAQVKEPMRQIENNKITHLEICRFVKLSEYLDKKFFTSYTEFYGVGEKETYSISYSPLWQFADTPVKLKEEVTLYKNLENNAIEKRNSDFSLLDVLDTIYWDISFIGGPAENSDFLESLSQKLDEYMNYPQE